MKPDNPIPQTVSPLAAAGHGDACVPERARREHPCAARCSRADMFHARYLAWRGRCRAQKESARQAGEEFPAYGGNTDVAPRADGTL